ncbi:MAG: hypothetical protein KDN19_13300 [Verrucomicrobiae bacterium]|nr:hypothetical protein [Verrucomicrobiae bacterium]
MTTVIADDGSIQRVKETHRVKPGPWGDLEYYYTYLEAPDSLVELVPVPSQQTVWRFPGSKPEDVRALFANSGMSEELIDELGNRSVWHISVDGIRVHPTDRVIKELPIGARLKIYQVLRGFEENSFHRNPVIIESGDVAGWFAGTGLSDIAIAAIDSLSYPLGPSLAFSDLPFLLGLMSSEKEERDLLRATTRTRTLILRLRVNKDSDFQTLSDYWTAGFKYKDILPLLESVQRTEGVERIDIAHLLPPLPRKLLYTFPSVSLGLSGRYPDSFWTALNFFEFWPKEKFLNTVEVEKEVRTNFTRVAPPYRYGDILVMIDPGSGRVVHSCVYLADDIVYTKNGPGLLRPWILMRMPDLITRLASEQVPVVEGWRRKDVISPQISGETPAVSNR